MSGSLYAYHRVSESQGLEGTCGDQKVQPPAKGGSLEWSH